MNRRHHNPLDYIKDDLIYEIDALLEMRGYVVSMNSIKNFVKKVKKGGR